MTGTDADDGDRRFTGLERVYGTGGSLESK